MSKWEPQEKLHYEDKLTCPKCGEEIPHEYEGINEDEMECDSCGSIIEFEIELETNIPQNQRELGQQFLF